MRDNQQLPKWVLPELFRVLWWGAIDCNPDLEALRNSGFMATKPRMCQDNLGKGGRGSKKRRSLNTIALRFVFWAKVYSSTPLAIR